MQRGRVPIPPTALLPNEITDDVLGTAVGPGEPWVAKDLVGVVEVGEDVALVQATVEAVDDLASKPAQCICGRGEPLLNEILAGYERTKLDDQDLGTKLDQSVQRVGPSAGQSKRPLRSADVGDEVGGYRRPRVQRAGLR